MGKKQQNDVWVQCERKSCQKWRRLPPGYKIEKDQMWFCEMNPDRKYNNCDLPEESYEDEDDIYDDETLKEIQAEQGQVESSEDESGLSTKRKKGGQQKQSDSSSLQLTAPSEEESIEIEQVPVSKKRKTSRQKPVESKSAEQNLALYNKNLENKQKSEKPQRKRATKNMKQAPSLVQQWEIQQQMQQQGKEQGDQILDREQSTILDNSLNNVSKAIQEENQDVRDNTQGGAQSDKKLDPLEQKRKKYCDYLIDFLNKFEDQEINLEQINLEFFYAISYLAPKSAEIVCAIQDTFTAQTYFQPQWDKKDAQNILNKYYQLAAIEGIQSFHNSLGQNNTESQQLSQAQSQEVT